MSDGGTCTVERLTKIEVLVSQSQAVWGWCLTSGEGSTCVAIVLECCYQPSLGWMFRCVTCIGSAVLLFCFRGI